MDPTHNEPESADLDAAYTRLVTRYSTPETVAAALERVTAEARRRSKAEEQATQGQLHTSAADENTPHDAARQPMNQPHVRDDERPPLLGSGSGATGPYSARPGTAVAGGSTAHRTAQRELAAGTVTPTPLMAPLRKDSRRTRHRYLAIEALVQTTVEPWEMQGLLPEHQRICNLCRESKSVAEISALLHIPLGVARILVADLAEEGLVALHQPGGDESAGGRPDVTLLERVLSGLRRL
ncbi:DUF742 domain-containing protein [Streptomyces europaeiscabiei]|uniref:DUF742 domain-containing protein n=1 Tax=Streptomyces europaeiscabiei TaxID=146819 RepID=A0AAJ2PLP9_9ACTN|nr:DUF742 domain-containing protein [Streptomyces europaeiscabiei]MDX3129607.1 DUF742 domain-containing protein [Streptomyces europaeiscabiei]